MQLDKKAVAGKQRFVLLKRLGEAFVSEDVTDRDVEEVINVCR
jgi:3-dehydroquinate synthetase